MEKQNLSSLNYYEALFTELKQNAVIAMDPSGVILEINTAFTHTFGYERQDIIGQNFSILFTKENQLTNLPGNELNRVLEKGQASDNNYLVKSENQPVWVSGESILLHDDRGNTVILKIFFNLQLLKESETSVTRLNEFSENILASIEDVVLVIDDELNIEKANTAFYNFFDNNPHQAAPSNFARILEFSGKNEILYDSILEATRTKKGFQNKILSVLTRAGHNKVFEISCTILQTGAANHLLLVMHDITLYTEIEREREDIIGFVAHELRNPLSNIMLCNELISRMAEEVNQQEILDLAKRSKNNTARLNKMVNELYEATKVSSGNFKLELSSFNLLDLVREAKQTFEVLQPAYTILIDSKTNEIIVKGDRYRLMQVIDNFLSNSIKYSNGNPNIYITLEADNEKATVSVTDEGLGISAAQLPHIFDRFFRAEKTKNLEGVGLGLYLCRQIILAHKGTIWAESEEGKGSTFFFSIPVKQN